MLLSARCARALFAFLAMIAIVLAADRAAAFGFQNNASSTESIWVIGETFHTTAPAIYRGRVFCDGRAFNDPRRGGECWECPAHFKRTIFAVTDAKACQRAGHVIDGWARAKYVAKARKGCPKGSFRNLLFDQCWACPPGFVRSLIPGVDLRKARSACDDAAQYHQIVARGRTVGADPTGLAFNPTRRPDALLRFSAYTTSQCGFSSATRVPTPDPAPGYTPSGKPCEIITFTMRANDRAVITLLPRGIASAVIYDVRGRPYRMFCKPVQPPDPRGGLRCEGSQKPIPSQGW
jgi:hypothetical protein